MKGPAETQVISKSYLTGLIVKCGLFFAAGLILTGVILYFSAHQPLGPSYQESFARLSQLKQEMLYKSIIIYSTLMVLVIGGVIFITLMYSHRVVGPLIGLKRIIRLMTTGDLTTPAVLRTKDAIKPMADSLNDFIGTYKNILENIKQKSDDMRTISHQTDNSNQLQMVQDSANEISAILNKLVTIQRNG